MSEKRVARAVELSAQKYCSASIMLGKTADEGFYPGISWEKSYTLHKVKPGKGLRYLAAECYGTPWAETGMRHVASRYLGNRHLTHHALQDAMDQAEIFVKMLAEAESR